MESQDGEIRSHSKIGGLKGFLHRSFFIVLNLDEIVKGCS